MSCRHWFRHGADGVGGAADGGGVGGDVGSADRRVIEPAAEDRCSANGLGAPEPWLEGRRWSYS